MISNLLFKLKNLKESKYIIVADSISKEEHKLLKEVLEDE